MLEEEMWWRRHGGDHVLGAARANVKRRGGTMRRGGLSVHVLLLFVPHCSTWTTAGASASPSASANHANALDCLDALSSEWAVRVAQSLDGCPLSAGRH